MAWLGMAWWGPGRMRWVLLLLAALALPARAETIVGTAGAGCIEGARELPAEGPGWQTIRASQSAFWGAPTTLAALAELARRAEAAGLGPLYMGDISGPLGGPLRGGHASHQRGIDADVYLAVGPKPALTAAQRDSLDPPSVVRPDGRAVDPAHWNDGIARLIRLAAELPDVQRVLVNPAIKARLCRDAGADRAWLQKVRPWWGHAAHMHLSFLCPPGQAACVNMAPPPPGDGCDATLDWWFAQLGKPAAPAKPTAPPVMPAFCRALLAR